MADRPTGPVIAGVQSDLLNWDPLEAECPGRRVLAQLEIPVGSVDELRVLVGQIVGERDTGLGFGFDLVPAAAPAEIAGDEVASGFGVVALQRSTTGPGGTRRRAAAWPGA